ncbi:MAG: cytochrome c oxidase subunit 3 [Myxococcota bacterium]|nr:cytochrome c oxidase subunit 3 [Myxococcota bacterium]
MTTDTARARPLLEPPGGMLMWIVVALELAVFSMVFALIAVLRVGDPGRFAAEQRALDPTLGLTMTFALLTSGWFAAEGVHAFRASRYDRARAWYAAAAVTGVAFVALKIYDYAAKYGAGHGLGSGDFWDAYLLGTGFHFAHVIVGVALLAYAAARIGKARFDDAETAVVGTALFWHMCDIAWFFLYPLFYVRS